MKILGKIRDFFSGNRYESERAKAQSGDSQQRAALAAGKKTHPEILFFLAGDTDENVRRAVAQNISTPAHISPFLAQDKSPDVRLALAGRLTTLLPDISQDQQSQIYAFTVQALGALAHDEVLKVRRALSTALAESAHAPPAIAAQLARDVEREVSEPILSFCVALSDDDLLDILSNHPEPWVISAVARRPEVSASVSQGVIDTGDVPAGAVLLRNAGAEISEATLMDIIDRARHMPEWHEPLTLRKDLSFNMAQHLAGFIDDSLLRVLEDRSDFDEETREEIRAAVTRRLAFAQDRKRGETAEQRALRLEKEGRLTDAAITDALSWRDMEFVVHAMGRLAKIPAPLAQKILDAQSPKAIMALSWRAGLSVRVAVQLQKDYASIAPKDLLYPRDGLYYPLSEDAMVWQLEFFGIPVKN